MKPEKIKAGQTAPFKEAELIELELRVAKRADKLWKGAGYCGGRDLVLWLQAEGEVLGKHFGLEWPEGALMGMEL